jgi:hypothetical protein
MLPPRCGFIPAGDESPFDRRVAQGCSHNWGRGRAFYWRSLRGACRILRAPGGRRCRTLSLRCAVPIARDQTKIWRRPREPSDARGSAAISRQARVSGPTSGSAAAPTRSRRSTSRASLAAKLPASRLSARPRRENAFCYRRARATRRASPRLASGRAAYSASMETPSPARCCMTLKPAAIPCWTAARTPLSEMLPAALCIELTNIPSCRSLS